MDELMVMRKIEYSDLLKTLEALKKGQQELSEKIDAQKTNEEFPEKMRPFEVAKALGVTQRTVGNYTKPGGPIPAYWDGNNQKYCKGEDVRKFKYGR